MANSLDSNITRKLIRVFLEKFESSRVLCKTIDTQLLSGKFTPSSGTIVDFKRPHDYNSTRTQTGDITGIKNDIIAGKASGVVQDFFTVAMDFEIIEEALELDQLDEIMAPAATRIVTDLEVDLGKFMIENLGLSYGDPDTAVTKWGDVAGAGAEMKAVGIPSDMPWYYVMNPFVTTALADTQSGLASGSNNLVDTAWQRAQISDRFGGLMAMTSNALKTRNASAIATRTGSLAAAPDGTYLTAKDTMTQAWSVTGFTASATLLAGEVIEVTGRNMLNLSTREVILQGDGTPMPFRVVVTEDVVLDGSGAGTVIVTGPGISEAGGQYNTIDTPLDTGDVLTILGTDSALYQPNLFYHKQAVGLGTVKLPKLYSTDTIATTEDGFSIRCSKYSDGDANRQTVRFDLLPAYAVFNPFFGGQGYGTP